MDLGYDEVKILMQLLSPIILFIGMSNITGSQYLISTKRQKQFTISVTIGAIVNVIFNFIFIRYYNALGAVIATLIAELSVTCVQLYFIRDKFNAFEIIKLAKHYVFSSVIMFIVTFIISFFIKSNVVCIFTQAIVGAIIYFVILLILKDDLFIDILKKIKFRSKVENLK